MARKAMQDTSEDMIKSANKKRGLAYHLVFLLSSNIKTTRSSKKLDDKMLGLFKVLQGLWEPLIAFSCPLPCPSMTFSNRACFEKLQTILYQNRKTSCHNLWWW